MMEIKPARVLVAAAVLAAVVLMIATRPAEATFPGVNDEIAFVSDRDGGNYEIYVMNPDGSNERRLTFHPAFDLSPAWSPNFGEIAFVRHSSSSNTLYTMDATGGDLSRVTRDARNPAWSPSGARIAFNRGGDIFTIKPDGSGLRRVTSSRAYDDYPSWSPDGTRIAFRRSRTALSGNLGIYTVTTTGTGLRRLTFGNGSEPNWAPDGTKLVFFTYDSGTDTYTISTVNADGSGQTPLTSGSFLVGPVFSPDGAKIAYYGIESGVPGYQVHVRNADGSGTPTALTSEGNNFTPDWRSGP
jgi:Tol biopolymer transport system component